MIEQAVNPTHVEQLDYFEKYTPEIDWQFMFVFGILIGSLVSATTSKTFKWQAVPDMWQKRFGASIGKRGIFAFIGGIIAIYGARLAGGCPSGHGLSGLIQMSISGYIALVCFFVGGVVAANLIYGKRGTK